MRTENSSSPLVHSRNLQRELTKLIDHVESDTKRVNDPRFRGLLEKSAEVLKSLRTLFERYGQGGTKNSDSRGRRAARSRKAGADTTSSDAGGTAANQATPRQKNKPQDLVGDAGTDENQTADHKESDGKENASAPGAPIARQKPEDPDEVAARIRQQRKEARAPKMPGGRSAPKPMPPRSGKPIFSQPHSA